MKKRLIAIIAVMTLAVAPSMAQVFILDGERNDREQNGANIITPQQGVDWDQYGYLPLGSGAALLVGFGAAYALAKRKRNDAE